MVCALMRKGFTEKDFTDVFEYLAKLWGEDAKMRRFFRPETVFKIDKFQSYLSASPKKAVTAQADRIAEQARIDHQEAVKKIREMKRNYGI